MSIPEKWALDPDMSARDPNNVNQHLLVSL